jgi:hypothetical protein
MTSLSLRTRKLIFLPALIATMGPHAGPKANKIKPNETTQAALMESFFPSARTKDGRFFLFNYYKYRFGNVLNSFAKTKFWGPGLVLVEFNDADTVIRVSEHKCNIKEFANSMCDKKPQDALLDLVTEQLGDDPSETYRLEDIRYCDIKTASGFRATGKLMKKYCPDIAGCCFE